MLCSWIAAARTTMWLRNSVTSSAPVVNELEAPAEEGGELLLVGEGREVDELWGRR